MKSGLLILCFGMFSMVSFAQAPCSTDSHDDFDFWVGKWDVFHTQADTIVGYNEVIKILGNCVIQEHWTGKGVSRGESYNTFDPVDSTWNQVWVDNAGNTLHFKGKLEDGAMKMQGKGIAQGKIVHYSLDFYPDKTTDTVRQIWNMSGDGGQTWNTIFDGTYKRVKE